MFYEPVSAYPSPLEVVDVARLVDAAIATDGINAPRQALAAAFSFAAEPADDLLITDEQGRELIDPRRLQLVHVGGGATMELTLRLLGCAGTTWERNARTDTAWPSPADPANTAGTDWMLPPVEAWRGPDGKASAALSVAMPSASHALNVINRAAEVLALGESYRRYNLTNDLRLSGQDEPCVMVAQVYRTPEGDFWAWPTVKGNNRTKSRQEILHVDQGLLLAAPDLLAALGDWAAERNAALAHADSNDHEARQALRIATVEARLVVGCPEPAALYERVQARNLRDHIHGALGFSAINDARAIGRRVLEAYHTAAILDETTFKVLCGDLPISRLPECPPDAGICEQRDLRSMLLLAEFFPTTEDKRRRSLIRNAMAEPEGERLDSFHKTERLRAYSAMCSVSWPLAWNPRVDDATLTLQEARAGVRTSGTDITKLLESAGGDNVAFAELIRLRAPQWLAAYQLVDADRGSMGAQTSRDEDGAGETIARSRRGIPDVLKAMNAQPDRALGLLRELAAAMDEQRAPQRVAATGKPLPGGPWAPDREWFDVVFPKKSGGRLPKTSYAATAADRPERTPVLQHVPPAEDKELAQRKKADVWRLLHEVELHADTILQRVDEARSHAAAASISPAWESNEAERLNIQAWNITEKLRMAIERTRPVSAEGNDGG